MCSLGWRCAIPVIDDFDNFDLTSTEPKAHRHFDPEMAGSMLNLHLHGCPLLPGPGHRRGTLPVQQIGSTASIAPDDQRNWTR
jgi:hypothetical protein